jgi:transcriptional regulator with XRE-family HTH domain
MPMSEDKPSRQKFKWTKELVHIALNDGMTQEEISKVCRTQQSVVSSWKNGKNKATEQQLAELLRRYGARLNRTTAKVYLVSNSPSGLVVKIGQQSYQEPEDTRIVQVEGPILFRYTFCQPIRIERAKSVDLGREPIARWIVHGLPRGKLLLVRQVRRALTDTRLERWSDAVCEVLGSYQGGAYDWVDCADDAGRWMSILSEPMIGSELIQLVDDYISDSNLVHSPHDELVLPYLIRKALVEHGHPVPGIDRITGLE